MCCTKGGLAQGRMRDAASGRVYRMRGSRLLVVAPTPAGDIPPPAMHPHAPPPPRPYAVRNRSPCPTRGSHPAMPSPARVPRAAAAALALLVLAAAGGGAAEEFMFQFVLDQSAGLGSATYNDVAKTLSCEARAAQAGTTLHGQTGRARVCAKLCARQAAARTGRRGGVLDHLRRPLRVP